MAASVLASQELRRQGDVVIPFELRTGAPLSEMLQACEHQTELAPERTCLCSVRAHSAIKLRKPERLGIAGCHLGDSRDPAFVAKTAQGDVGYRVRLTDQELAHGRRRLARLMEQ